MIRIDKQNTVELLAPAGNWECLRAAVANGADAVYFGVQKFNARARAKNFVIDELPDILSFLHLYGVKGFLTFNILIFENELEDAKRLIEVCMDAGVDAVIVQDLGLVKLIRELSPDFPIHGSTQMTVTSPEAVEFIRPFGMERVVLGRENNLKQIAKISNRTKLPLEVFVHGALCVSYSGQCLTSEVWGGRSANRGECAQACRLPYDLICDGEKQDMGHVAYLLSPKDLAAIDLIPELIEAGVTSFKIEGRLKSPEYVANVVSKYRHAIDEYMEKKAVNISAQTLRELQQSFSRGFTHGFLQGTNNKQLVEGTFPKSRGVFLGRVVKVLPTGVLCEIENPLKRGDGIVFDAGDPTKNEEGGRVYEIFRKKQKIEGEVEAGTYELQFGRNAIHLRNIHIGDRIWKTSDPELDRRLRKTFETDQPFREFPLQIEVSGNIGEELQTVWTDRLTGHSVAIASCQPLEQAVKRPLTAELLQEQLGRLGGTIFYLEQLDTEQLGSDVILPVKELNRMRREAVVQLETLRKAPPVYQRRKSSTGPRGETNISRQPFMESAPGSHDSLNRQRPFYGAYAETPQLVILCRTIEQVEAACGTDVQWIYADFEFTKQYRMAVETARSYGKAIALATPRILMPDEHGILKAIELLRPDAILVRNTGALWQYRNHGCSIPLIGDFSLNIANHKAAELFLERGCEYVTPSYDLNVQQMIDLLRNSPAAHMELVIHQHMPMFHTEHCVYCTFLSEGTDYTNCGRPCEEHRVSLKDRVGFEHPVRVDTGCRNTVFHAVEQSGSEYLEEFRSLGIRRFRIEFLEEPGEKVLEVIRLYQRALAGEIPGRSVWKQLNAINQLGVTRGQLDKVGNVDK
ncbi:U32 family peptidase [Fodinisporobacter ferrooxydans]|uniref:U32 family peptidase n=1 Tax=Fodinisporobacter ferrooxydans TaxID=2901836 RepID=A0ABY4CFS0_9BACL|nr:U32 family peptidase [Alicyclobacillaceae bacterium MYW30-H2]